MGAPRHATCSSASCGVTTATLMRVASLMATSRDFTSDPMPIFRPERRPPPNRDHHHHHHHHHRRDHAHLPIRAQGTSETGHASWVIVDDGCCAWLPLTWALAGLEGGAADAWNTSTLPSAHGRVGLALVFLVAFAFPCFVVASIQILGLATGRWSDGNDNGSGRRRVDAGVAILDFVGVVAVAGAIPIVLARGARVDAGRANLDFGGVVAVAGGIPIVLARGARVDAGVANLDFGGVDADAGAIPIVLARGARVDAGVANLDFGVVVAVAG